MSFIELKNVTKAFHAGEEEYPAVRSVSLALRAASLSLLWAVGLREEHAPVTHRWLEPSDLGRRLGDGIDLGALGPNKLSDFRREYLGFVFQSFYLVPYLTAVENVMLPLTVQPGMNGKAKDSAQEALRKVGLDAKAHRLPSQLSGGEQERVAIARAIVNRPPVILADEPTGNLDTRTATMSSTCCKTCTGKAIPS